MKEGKANNDFENEQIFLRKLYSAKLLSFDVSPHLKSYSLSSIWISKPLLCTGLFLASLNIVGILSYHISLYVYG